MRVLVIEDEMRMARLPSARLRRRAAPSTSRGTARRACGWRPSGPAAIGVDVVLPGFDGLGLSRRLRKAGVWVAGADAHRP